MQIDLLNRLIQVRTKYKKCSYAKKHCKIEGQPGILIPGCFFLIYLSWGGVMKIPIICLLVMFSISSICAQSSSEQIASLLSEQELTAAAAEIKRCLRGEEVSAEMLPIIMAIAPDVVEKAYLNSCISGNIILAVVLLSAIGIATTLHCIMPSAHTRRRRS